MVIESDTCRCARWAAARDVIRGKRRDLAGDEVFFGADGLAGGEAFGDQESVGSNAQRRVMMESTPASSFIMTEPQFLLQVLVVAFNAPTRMRLGHQVVQGNVVGQRRQVVLERIFVVGRPFDQQPSRVRGRRAQSRAS